MTQFVHALALFPFGFFQNELIFNTFPQEARLATHPGSGILQRQSDKIRMKITQNITFTPPLKLGVGELYQNRFKRRIRLHHIDHDMSKVEHDRINAFLVFLPGIHKFQQRNQCRDQCRYKITQPKILFKTAMRPAC